ncbi:MULTISPECIES: TetR-like C-terminal domain-containing protein [unclassified Clostridium]|uniref:TetR/AcrR family transcriptional regulator n=1 Tax=unclassified Clostridium TaxID=2614128 RepID=UPI0002977B9A|nr:MULTISPECIES: TetR-like C-terminal domain-containing protein [unclassified Clostridium]EKQ51475.1 MAG: transcriptional regulator [Clostridium sp. Maddingley MBC34-26]
MSRGVGITQENILQAAAEIADANGLNEVTLAELAKKLQIRTPSLYNHIDGLQQLRKKLSIYSMEQLYNDLVQSSIGISGDDAIRALSKAYLSFARIHPGLYESTFSLSDSNDIEVQKAANKIVDLVVRILNAYELDEESALHVTRGLRSILHGFSSLEQKGGFELSLNIDISFQLLMDTYLEGLHIMKQNSSKKS